MAEFPSMPLFTDSYWADTVPELSLEEHGCYMLLLITQWRRPDDCLPDDDKWFQRLLSVHGNKWKILRKNVLERFFVKDENGHFYQKRLRKERDFLMKSKRNRREIAKKAADERWKNKDLDNAESNARARDSTPTPIDSESDTSSESLSGTAENHPNSEQTRSSRDEHDSRKKIKSDFDDWWSCWTLPGTKRGRSAAKRKYNALIKNRTVDHETLCSAVRLFMAKCREKGTETRYIAHPTTWLNQGRWDDDLSEIITNGKGNGHGRQNRPNLYQAADEVLRRHVGGMENGNLEHDHPAMAGDQAHRRPGDRENGNHGSLDEAHPQLKILDGEYQEIDEDPDAWRRMVAGDRNL